MKPKNSLTPTIPLILLFAFASCTTDHGWTDLLDPDLSHWEIYLSYKHQNDYNGQPPTDENGLPLEPIGYNNNENIVFTMIEEHGEPVLHISGEIYGCIFSKEEYENYHLSMKMTWGKNKWEPRLDKLKDSGILYHSIGEAGVDYWRSWMLSQEFQIMEGHMGDYWSIANSAIDVRAFIPEGIMNSVAGHRQPFLPLGSGTGRDGFCLRSADYEDPEGWNTLELICFDDKSLHIVNGEVVMVLQNSRYVTDGKSFPLIKGKIQLQSEAAEIFFKHIRIKSIDGLSLEHSKYFD